MPQEIKIWCPVVISSLKKERRHCQNMSCQTSQNYRRMEDMKVRIKFMQAQVLGNYIEARAGLSCIWLLEDEQGRSCVEKREELLIDRIAPVEFNVQSDIWQELKYIPELIDFHWDAMLKGNLISVRYELRYQLMGTKEQLLLLQNSLQQGPASAPQPYPLHTGDSFAGENQKLRRQAHIYESNINSLKRAVQKAEKERSGLHSQLKNCQDTIETLQKTVDDQNHIIKSQFRQPQQESARTGLAPEPKLGRRIRHLFTSNQ